MLCSSYKERIPAYPKKFGWVSLGASKKTKKRHQGVPDNFLFSSYFFLRHSENERVIPKFCQVLGTMNNGSQPRILGWEPSFMAPNEDYLVGSHYSWCPTTDENLELPCHSHYVSKKSNRKIKNYLEDLNIFIASLIGVGGRGV